MREKEREKGVVIEGAEQRAEKKFVEFGLSHINCRILTVSDLVL